MSDFGIDTATYPIDSAGPVTVKDNSFVSDLKEKLETVEFDTTEKTLFP